MTLLPFAIRLLITETTPGPSAIDSTRVTSTPGKCSSMYFVALPLARTHDEPEVEANSTKATFSLSDATDGFARRDPTRPKIIVSTSPNRFMTVFSLVFWLIRLRTSSAHFNRAAQPNARKPHEASRVRILLFRIAAQRTVGLGLHLLPAGICLNRHATAGIHCLT